MEDVLDVYHRPYDPARPVVCMDESNKQLTKETRIPIPMKPGHPERVDHEYERNGVADVFMFVEPLAGWRRVDITASRKSMDWAQQVKTLLDSDYAKAEKVVLVMDNLNTHCIASLYAAFPPQEAKRLADRLEIHYTPKHGSWLNIAEIELSALSKQCLSRRIPDMQTMRREVTAWSAKRNQKQKIINWQFSTEEARVKLKYLYPVL